MGGGRERRPRSRVIWPRTAGRAMAMPRLDSLPTGGTGQGGPVRLRHWLEFCLGEGEAAPAPLHSPPPGAKPPSLKEELKGEVSRGGRCWVLASLFSRPRPVGLGGPEQLLAWGVQSEHSGCAGRLSKQSGAWIKAKDRPPWKITPTRWGSRRKEMP